MPVQGDVLGSAIVEITAPDSKYNKSLDGMEKDLVKFDKKTSALTANMGKAFLGFGIAI